MSLTLRKAQRKRVKMRIALAAPSGGGKTASSLVLAYGIVKGEHPDWSDEEIWSKIAVIDTENGSAELYCNHTLKGTSFTIGEYNAITLEPPFTSDRYIEGIELCENNNIEVCIVDSMSHLWAGEGGILSEQSNIAKRTGNSYTAWKTPTENWNKFINKMLSSKVHIICTMRSKTEYVQQKDERGKTTVRRVGMQYVARDQSDYEFSIFFDLDTDHQAMVTKDRTGIFDGQYFTITADTGMKIAKWLDSGAVEVENKPIMVTANSNNANKGGNATHSEAELAEAISQIDNLAKALGEAGVSKTDIANAIKKHFVVNGKPSANYNAIKNSEVAEMVIKELESLIK